MNILIIVESPSKTKTISKYLKDEKIIYTVLSSKGHIAKLKDSGFQRFGVDMETWEPDYGIAVDKRNIVKELKEAVLKNDKIIIATDDDREGETIGANLVKFLKLKDYSRIRFGEITEEAIKKSLGKQEKLNQDIIDSQKARAILDKIIGYSVSGLLRRKIKNAPMSPTAGRVQSVSLRIVIDKENEIEKFKPVEYSLINSYVSEEKELIAEMISPNKEYKNNKWNSRISGKEIYSKLNNEMVLKTVEESERNLLKKTPIKQAALYSSASSIGLTTNSIQSSSQKLYEAGLITYPRTDAIRYSDFFMKNAKDFITKNYHKNDIRKDLIFKTGDQNAHESIRPTELNNWPSNLDLKKFGISSTDLKVYKYIYNTTLQSLMISPKIKIFTYKFDNSGYEFRMSSSLQVYEGYNKVTNKNSSNITKELESMSVGDIIPIEKNVLLEQKTKPPARYNAASLISKLDEVKVGRPSTFNYIINKLISQEYVLVDSKSFIPTDFGKLVNKQLNNNFSKIVDIEYTSNLEEKLNEIANSNLIKNDFLDSFYKKFQENINDASKTIEITIMDHEFVGKKCPLDDGDLIYRRNKRTKQRFIGCANFPNCKHMEVDPDAKPVKRRFFKKK